MLGFIFTLGCAYLVGAIPTGYWFARYFFNIDVRLHGSGNIGATNVARVLGSSKYFFLIFTIDAGKAAAVIFCTRVLVLPFVDSAWNVPLLCSVAAMLIVGNSFSIFLSGGGGKNVATLLGCIGMLYPVTLLVFILVVWGIIFLLFRKVFIASVVGALTGMILYWTLYFAQHGFVLGLFLTLASLWLVWRHRGNFKAFFARSC